MPQVSCLTAEGRSIGSRRQAGGSRLMRAGVCALVGMLAACSPALDWRQARPHAWGVVLLMPCRPDQHERLVPLADLQVRLGMLVCEADGHTYALATALLAEPAQVGPALLALASAARANLQGRAGPTLPAQVKGMTPRPEAGQWQLQGSLPDGRPVTAQALVFAHGMRVFQATVIGPRTDLAMAQAFFGAIEIPP